MLLGENMKKGFTLIEVLGILALLGVIIVVAMPTLIEDNKRAKENKVRDFNDIINTACDNYRVVESMNSGTVTIGTLITDGYLKSDLKLPNGNAISTINGTAITITSSGCNYNYSS